MGLQAIGDSAACFRSPSRADAPAAGICAGPRACGSCIGLWLLRLQLQVAQAGGPRCTAQRRRIPMQRHERSSHEQIISRTDRVQLDEKSRLAML